ncbi:MAG: hypothetical protein ACI92E_002717 [Oceanicoccus sp.]|jgi:hypothetical protein
MFFYHAGRQLWGGKCVSQSNLARTYKATTTVEHPLPRGDRIAAPIASLSVWNSYLLRAIFELIDQ